MTLEIALTLAIIAGALVLFGTEKLRVDTVALLVLISVGLLRLVGPEDVFSGFSNSAVITVWAVYIVSGGMFSTGVAEIMGRFITRLSGDSEVRLIAVIMLTCGIISAFVNNVGATAMLLPAVVSVANQKKIAVSKLLIPLSFSSLLGGKLTLIGTPANILATNIVANNGLPTFGFFDFAPIGLVVFTTGIVYMTLIGRHLLPVRQSPNNQQNTRQLREYISEVLVTEQSPLANRTLFESRLGAEYDLTVIALVRNGRTQSALTSTSRIHAGDYMVVEGSFENLLRAKHDLGLVIEAEPHLDPS